MGGQWKDLAVDPEGADAELMAALDGRSQCVRIMCGDLAKIAPRDW
jgi:hypothetical protein